MDQQETLININKDLILYIERFEQVINSIRKNASKEQMIMAFVDAMNSYEFILKIQNSFEEPVVEKNKYDKLVHKGNELFELDTYSLIDILEFEVLDDLILIKNELGRLGYGE